MSVDLLEQATERVNLAIKADEVQNYNRAYRLYNEALEFFMVVIRREKNPETKGILMQRVGEYMGRAELLKKTLGEGSPKKEEGPKKKIPQGGGEDESLKGALDGTILQETPNISWDQVAGLEEAKIMLKEAVILPQRFPKLFTEERRPWRGILLYGPPGTGKSFLAKAVATEAESTFFSVSSSDLISKWQGESQKLVRALFERAREKAPSIIFIDEVDALVSSRAEGENASQLQIKTEFLTQMDGVGRGKERVLVLGATNTPWTLDPAMRRRFEKRIYIPLPSEEAREEMFRLNIGKTPTTLLGGDLRDLGKSSEGFSGADISIAVRGALMEPIKRAQSDAFFKKDPDGTYSLIETPEGQPPCHKCPMRISFLSPKRIECRDCGSLRMSLYDVEPGSQVKAPKVSLEDFKIALKKAKPSVAPKELKRFEEWTQEFGEEG